MIRILAYLDTRSRGDSLPPADQTRLDRKTDCLIPWQTAVPSVLMIE